MHPEAREFTAFCKKHFPEFFTNKNVLDVGSGDINGNNRFLFDDSCSYAGNDVFEAPNVTIVSKTKDLTFPDECFDTIISTECFEHDPEYAQSFAKIVKMLKKGGLFVFTCASTNRPEHGTRRSHPDCSFGTIGNVEGWTDYYKNLTIEDVDASIDICSSFRQFQSFYNGASRDLYFWGIKSEGKQIQSAIVYTVPEYVAPMVTNTTADCVRLTVLSAFYGTQTARVSVTEKFRREFQTSNDICIDTTVNLNALFGDPAVGEPKTLFFSVKLTGSGENVASFALDEFESVLRKPFRLSLSC